MLDLFFMVFWPFKWWIRTGCYFTYHRVCISYLLLFLLPTTDNNAEVEANLDKSLSVNIPIKSKANSSNAIKYFDTSSPRYTISLLSLSKSLSISSPSSPTTAIIIASAASLSVLVPTATANSDTVASLTNLPAHSNDDDDDDPPIPLLYQYHRD